jgi:MFS family permease
MGASTFLVGLLPSYEPIGWIAPVILIVLRMAQGLALGGEYGGAAVYVAEHAPVGRRGFYTAWIQTTATLGLLLSLIVIRGPALRTWARRTSASASRLAHSVPALDLPARDLGLDPHADAGEPAFQKMKEEGTQSKAPLSEAFGQWKNGKMVCIALLGLVAGQAVVWYTGQFYALFFLQSILKIDLITSNVLIAWSLIIGTGGFIFFGSLSDRIGRKPMILGGCLIAAITYFPLFGALTNVANPDANKAIDTVKVAGVVRSRPVRFGV